MEDEKIIELYFNRSEKALEETALKYGKYCFTIAYSILSDNEDAEESVNDTYLDAWRSIPPHKPSMLSTFLGKITRRISIDKWRKRTADKRGGGEIPLVLDELEECVSDGKTVEEEYSKERLSEAIRLFISRLPKTEKSVFLCRYWYMDSVDSICKQFSFSESKVKSMLKRTRDKLRAYLAEEGFE